MRRGQAWPGGGKNEFWILKNKKMRCRSWRLRRPLLLISRLLFSGIPFRKLYKVEEEVRVSVKVMTLAVTLLYFSSTSDPNFPSYISVLLLLLFLFFQLGELFRSALISCTIPISPLALASYFQKKRTFVKIIHYKILQLVMWD